MPKHDVTKLNVAIDRLLATTENPRHRFLLQAYSRHRYLEVAGRYEELFAPDMMVETPCYHFKAGGIKTKLEGQANVKNLYRLWTETNQSIFYVEREQVAVADNFIASTSRFYQGALAHPQQGARLSTGFSVGPDPEARSRCERHEGRRERDVSLLERA